MGDIQTLIETLAQDANPVRLAPHPLKLCALWLAAAIVYLALAFALSGLRPDIMLKLHQPWFVAEIVTLALIIASTSLSAALLAYPDLHQMRRTAFTPAYALGALVLILIYSWIEGNIPAPPHAHTFECAFDIALFALLPAAWTLFVMRRFASTHYRLAASIALLFAFSIGAFWLRLHEQNDSINHLMQWHYLPMLGCGVLGLWLGKLLLKW